MVKKTDAYARVLRPGESVALGRKNSEFEIVLFRPRHHVRAEGAEHPDLNAEADAALQDHDSTSKDSTSNQGGAVAAVAGNKVKFALGPGVAEMAPNDRKRNGASLLSPSAANSVAREPTTVGFSDEAGGSPLGKRNSNGGYEASFADLAAEAPLFFDTTVCIFYDELTKMDYVATGRTTADSKGIHYIPHLVTLGDEIGAASYCNYNITRPDGESLAEGDEDAYEEDDDVLVSRNAASNGPTTMAAADGISVNMRRLSACAGFLVCATLFSKDSCLNRERNVFYMVRKPRSPTPLCLIPLCVFGEPSRSCVSVMVRKVRAHGDAMWEIVNVNEGIALQDVKSLVLKLQDRGLKDPAHFSRDFELKSAAGRSNDETGGGEDDDLVSSSAESSSSELETYHSPKNLSEVQEQEHSFTGEKPAGADDHHSTSAHSRGGRTFSGLLADVPRVTREGRRQYNIGRSHVQSNLFDGDTSEEDEVLDDAMRAVVPCYANTSLIRYENGAYNVGSKAEKLVTHYVDHRETYGLDAAGHRSTSSGRGGVTRETLLPLLNVSRGRSSADWGTPIPVLDRCQTDEELVAPMRPELPPDLLVTSEDRRLAVSLQQHRGSVSAAIKKRQSTAGRARRSSSLRLSNARRGTTRPSSSTANAQRSSQPRKKTDSKVARSKPTSGDALPRPEDVRGANLKPTGQSAASVSDSSSPSRLERQQTQARSSSTKQKAPTKPKGRAVAVK